jgi:hypothetical protein
MYRGRRDRNGGATRAKKNLTGYGQGFLHSMVGSAGFEPATYRV